VEEASRRWLSGRFFSRLAGDRAMAHHRGRLARWNRPQRRTSRPGVCLVPSWAMDRVVSSEADIGMFLWHHGASEVVGVGLQPWVVDEITVTPVRFLSI
jgi:hypothetical protein